MDELAEDALVLLHAGHFAVPQRGDAGRQLVPASRNVAFLQVVQEHQSCRLRDSDKGGLLRGRREPCLDRTQDDFMVGQDHVIL